jgi:hypothetical protein
LVWVSLGSSGLAVCQNDPVWCNNCQSGSF